MLAGAASRNVTATGRRDIGIDAAIFRSNSSQFDTLPMSFLQTG
jgi:hypothetical protein